MGFGLDDEEASSLDENDPSEAWTSPRLPEFGVHTPNGPLGSDYLAGNVAVAPHAKQAPGPSAAGLGAAPEGTPSQGIAIGKAKKKKQEVAGSLISHSMQEEFKGFSFSGGESLVVPASLAARLAHEQADGAPADEEVPEPNTDDEFDNDRAHGGRYASAKRGGFDDDM